MDKFWWAVIVFLLLAGCVVIVVGHPGSTVILDLGDPIKISGPSVDVEHNK